MFNSIDLNEKYSQYLAVKKSASKVGKIFGIIAAVLYILIALVVCFAGDELTSGAIALLVVFSVVFVFMFVQMGKNIAWTYHWELERSGDSMSATTKAMYLNTYVGPFLRLKYHNYGKKIKKEYNK